ncbi:anthranilate synthase component I family protein [Microbacterium sp. NPDC076911]|uniref:anthranilate synthase component I family protein n=1 Tax=Microbacterium sp. NPDC076911 TaxID=3154958 RepID=UPI00342D20A3
MAQVLSSFLCDQWIDPSRVHSELSATSEHSFWLDAGPAATRGWSWVGVGVPEPDAALVNEVVCVEHRQATDTYNGTFRGGWVGWMGYDDSASRAGAPSAVDRFAIPQQLWLRATQFFAFDHAHGRMWALAPAGDLASLIAIGERAARATAVSVPRAPRRDLVPRHSPEIYASLIERCRDSISRGDAYQLCLATRFELELGEQLNMHDVYARLRLATPSHHGALIMSAGVALASASPERFLEVSRSRVRTRPIKGTRPRGSNGEADAASRAELIESEKERAENVMIVDLMRNDLSKVCLPGSVAVEELLAVESYAAVHQLVSTVAGTLAPETTVGNLLAATSPAGSMSGAPKLSAMTILHALEGDARGLFGGCFGWIGDDGGLDLAMVIRSIVAHPDGAYVGAGGGITWHSKPADEVAEVGIKARGPLAALGAALPPGWCDIVG